MPAAPKHLKAKTPAPKRDPRVPDVLWNLPARLELLSVAHGFFQKDVAKAAKVDQATVSRWLHFKGLDDVAAAKLVRIEQGLKLGAGALLPQADPEDAAALKNRATQLGVVPMVLSAIGDGQAGELMQAFNREVRQAILGIVHVYEVPLEKAAEAAQRAIKSAAKDLAPGARMTPPFWYDRIRDLLKSSDESGTHPQSDKIRIALPKAAK